MNVLRSKQIAWPAYLVAGLLILIPLADAFTSTLPWRPTDSRWRFGAFGLIANSLLIPVLGVLVAYVAALILEHRVMRRVIGIVGFVCFGIAVLALVMFALDALQTRAAVREQMQLTFTVASTMAAVKTLLAAATFLAFGVASMSGRQRAKPVSSPVLIAKAGEPSGATTP